MCGRVVSSSPRDVLARHFDITEVVGDELPPRYNVSPTASLYAVADTTAGRRLGLLQWGLVPSWAPDPTSGPRPINARVETLLDRPHFAAALERRRCLIPADGFYEWEKQTRQPYFISAPDGSPLAFAGLWDRWVSPEGRSLVTCVIVTTPANETVAGLHDRMPAILERDVWSDWLDPTDDDPVAASALLRPAESDILVVRPASRRVNSTANDGPELLDPDEAVVPPPLQLPL